MATRIADARSAALSARRRLAVTAVAEGAANGALFGALIGALIALAALLLGRLDTGLSSAWILALPAAGAFAFMAQRMAHLPSLMSAALRLDRAAGTHEAFVSALTAEDAPSAFRELAAEQALRRCPVAGVARALPFAWPRRVRGAVVAVGLLSAVVLVAGPRDGATAASPRSYLPPGQVLVRAPSDGSAPGRLGEDLRDASAERLREAAEALLGSAGRVEAERALAALDAGDTTRARIELERALARAAGGTSDGGPGGVSGLGNGDGPGSAGGQSAGTPAPWSSGNWPLRYDRAVERWMELVQASADHEEAR